MPKKYLPFDPIFYVRNLLINHDVDSRAHVTHCNKTGKQVLRYRVLTNGRIVLGTPRNSDLVYAYDFRELDATECANICQDLGVI